MRARGDIIDGFLSDAGWARARRVPLAGDASFRRYERVHKEEKRAVLMDAPPGKEDVRPFLEVAKLLHGMELSAPRVYASDVENGLLLLEDLGDDLFARVLDTRPAVEAELYIAAAGVLASLYRAAPRMDSRALPPHDAPRMMQQVAVMSEWFLPLVAGAEKARALAPAYLGIWQELLTELPDLGSVLVLYDFHAENLLWLPDREAAKRVGLLDFQDAFTGSPAYDMVSYLEDARRDVTPATVTQVIEHYLTDTGLPHAEFMQAYALLGTQRNCRIVGTFARLALRDGKHHYLAYLPRVWQHLARDLEHPALLPLKRWMDETIRPEWRGVVSADGMKERVAG